MESEDNQSYVCEENNVESHNQSSKRKMKVKTSYQCEKCNKPYASKRNLEVHFKTVHDKIKPYRCDICWKTFGYAQSYESHVKTMHSSVKPYECRYCGKDFGDMRNLHAH